MDRAEDLDWLVDVLSVDTVSPLEGGDPRGFAAAQDLVEKGAAQRGFTTVARFAPGLALLDDPLVPAVVTDAADEYGPDFLAAQPSVVLGIGDATDAHRTMVINFHLDTVGPHLPPRLDGEFLRGRGTVDDKGPGIAAMTGVARAFARRPELREHIRVLVMSVPAEEGGALGTYGTRFALRQAGIDAALMVVAEPTGNRFLDCSSAVMTPQIAVSGQDSTDDHPYEGTNATLVLGHAAVHLSRTLAPVAEEVNAKLCIAGLHTGTSHNRVYGTGSLKLNIAYYDDVARARLEAAVERAFRELPGQFRSDLAGSAPARQVASRYEQVVTLNWLKRGYPALANRHPRLEGVLAAAGLERHDGAADGSAFTCDAIWAAEHAEYVVVCGPGDLGRNGAHTDLEHVRLQDLQEYAERMERLTLAFAEHVRSGDQRREQNQRHGKESA
ncbi:M20/M25/M40 family metallo-hydrolase [Streptomyces cyaneus]|uniref:M20/M25/M40 family metallo-hydrolase n=1 Tax=Streptomyces cyaneus TaxID=1904 RepID=UPI000FF8B640|nr:M20/M25/M40 family metallo-hydrolase [Streptomyces cyaneus]